MTSRELVQRTLAFDRPTRVPRQLWLLPWAIQHHPAELRDIQDRYPDDLIGAPGFCRSLPATVGDPYRRGQYVDEWGCVFENLQEGVIGEVKQPPLASWNELDRLRMPAEWLTIDPEQINDFCRHTDCYVLSGACPRPFERLQFLRGTPNLLMDLLERPPELTTLIDQLHGFYLQILERWARTDVDALGFMDDWGSQRGMLIDPVLWRELFKPLYRDYIELAHRSGKAIFMHSDGHILEILPDLIELGLDAINSQLFCMGLDRVTRFAGQITFWGELDRQHILPQAKPSEIIGAVDQMRAALYREGGVIAQCEFGPGARPENVMAYFSAWDPGN